MGFFSRKNDEEKDKSVAQVIRSRFYGKHRREKTPSPGISYHLHPSSAGDSDKHSTYASSADTSYEPSHYTGSIASRRILKDATSIPDFASGLSSNASHAPITPTKPRLLQKAVPNTLPKAHKPHVRADTSPGAGPSTRTTKRNSVVHAPGARTSTDAVTMTLAQRLNELAVANAEGLLNDDEYRLLRQNLFERSATHSQAPSEVPVVPAVGPSPSRRSTTPYVNPNLSRSPSVRSKNSIASSVTSLFRRTTNTGFTSRQSVEMGGDAASVLSSTTNRSGSIFRRPGSIAKVSSAASLREGRQSISSDAYIATPPRSARSVKRAPPPSAYHSTPPPSTRALKPSSNGLIEEDDEHLKTSKDIKGEIAAVEAEGRRLLDAFNGLELTTLTRKSPQTRLTTKIDGESLRRSGSAKRRQEGSLAPRSMRDGDAVSMRSGTSVTSSNHPPSLYNASPTASTHSRSRPLVTKPVSLRRKISLTSVSSSVRGHSRGGGSIHIPPVPTMPSPLGRMNAELMGSTTSLSLGPSSLHGGRSSGHLPLHSVFESEGATTYSSETLHDGGHDSEIHALEAEMAQIRKRRAEVTARYETRLEYLRAKLKGAELHEKLLRK